MGWFRVVTGRRVTISVGVGDLPCMDVCVRGAEHSLERFWLPITVLKRVCIAPGVVRWQAQCWRLISEQSWMGEEGV